jgi:hypothetical protein
MEFKFLLTILMCLISLNSSKKHGIKSDKETNSEKNLALFLI